MATGDSQGGATVGRRNAHGRIKRTQGAVQGRAIRVLAGRSVRVNYPGRSADFVVRLSDTGEYVLVESKNSPRASRSTSKNVPLVGAIGAAQRKGARKSLPADDPLAPERTRWLADAVGGGSRLAELLKVSPSQTSRWASGEERPGATAAPLLIDLEHVLARVRLVWAEPSATVWMTSANAHLGGSRPIDVLRLQGVGPVLEALDAGAWGGAA